KRKGDQDEAADDRDGAGGDDRRVKIPTAERQARTYEHDAGGSNKRAQNQQKRIHTPVPRKDARRPQHGSILTAMRQQRKMNIQPSGRRRSDDRAGEPLPNPPPWAYLEELFASLGGCTETPASFHVALRSRPNGIHPARSSLSPRRARSLYVARDPR